MPTRIAIVYALEHSRGVRCEDGAIEPEKRMSDYEAKQAARKSLADALKAANPGLVPVSDKVNALVAAAKNIRIELKRAFPGVKFTVRTERYSGGDSINVGWIDGPMTDQVRSIIGKYAAGTFDGMTDCYNYAPGAWNTAFGDAKYVFANRDMSEAGAESAIRTVFAKYAGNLKDIARPTGADVKAGRVWAIRVPGLNDGLCELINVEWSRRTWALTKGAPAVEEVVA